jgi:FkbM family methyltransferase
MISSFARWLVRMQCYYLSGIFLTLASKLVGSGCKITYDRQGFWKHKVGSVTINEAFPNIRMDIGAIEKFNEDVYFYAYKPRPNDVCIDVGAGIGTETIWLSKKIGPGGKVYAVEASAYTYKILKANVIDNQLSNVICLHLAISDRAGKVRISDIADAHILNSILGTTGTEVEAVSMDEFIRSNGIGRIDFLKVNIEGAEKLVIRDFKKISEVRHASISCHDFLGRRNSDPGLYTRDLVISFLTENGFALQFRDTGVDYVDDQIYGTNEKFL